MNTRVLGTLSGDESLDLPFRPRARILQLLGDELIGSPRIAVFELVKNAYDADAETVSVVLNDIDNSRASIVIQDDGEGMTLKTIRNIWLIPGHDHRARQREAHERTRLGRLPLGEKGLGRFAAHKLGDRIEVVTRAANAKECVVSIDWTKLLRRTDLSDAKVRVETRAPEIFRKKLTGTRITISRLREKNWTRGEVRRLQRQVTSISSPFTGVTDEFTPKLEVPGHEDWLADVPDIDALLKRAPWDYEFRFDQGLFNWRYRFRGIHGINLQPRTPPEIEQPLQVRFERDLDLFGQDNQGGRHRSSVIADASFAEGIGPVTGEFFVFDRDPAVLARLGERKLIQEYLDENGGIRVYRDGIRVYNYGEPDDDWLGLDLRRVNLPARSLSKNIVVGAVNLSLEDSHGLMEKTNREGFVENQALRQLKRIVIGALTPLEVERKKDKDKIRQLTGRGKKSETRRIRQPLQELRRAARKHNVHEELEPIIDRVEKEYDELRNLMLRAGLSGMGLAVVFHEVEQGVRGLCSLIEAGGEHKVIRSSARQLARVLNGFTVLLRKDSSRSNSLKKLVRRIHDINRVRFQKHRVRLDGPTLHGDLPDVKADFSFGLALGALNNLLDNAFYWLRVRWPDADDEPSKRAIYMNTSLDLADGPAVVVADTGPGFSDEPEELTSPFFSRRPEGMGLGLYYASLVMELGGGKLTFPDASEAGVPEEFAGAVLALVFPKEKQS